MKPTPEQIKERAELWAQALEANYGREARGRMRDGAGRCCLAVAEDVAEENGAAAPKYRITSASNETVEWFGWDRNNPNLIYKKDKVSAMCLNDVERLSHKQIAAAVRETFL